MDDTLNSDHVNYLVWRYLQERGYGKSAIQLSRDWGFHNPQQLPFAPSVSPQTLVSVVQDGLTYDSLLAHVNSHHGEDRSEGRSPFVDKQDGRRYKFTLAEYRRRRASDSVPTRSPSLGHAMAGARRKPRLEPESLPTTLGSAHSNSTKSRSTRKPIDPAAKVNGDAMEVEEDDQDQAQDHTRDMEDAQDYEREMREDLHPPQPLPFTLDIGQSTGMQSEQADDKPTTKSISNSTIPGTDIFSTQWHSSDPKKLLIAGGSTWHEITLPHVAQDDEKVSDPLVQQTWSAEDRDLDRFFVSALAKSATRQEVAFALEEEDSKGHVTGSVRVHGQANMEQVLSHPNETLTMLRWNESGNFLLGCSSPDDESGTVLVWDFTVESSTFAAGKVSRSILDAAWLSGDSFAICGEDYIDIFKVGVEAKQSQNEPDDATTQDREDAESVISKDEEETERLRELKLERLTQIETESSWQQLRYDSHSNLLACISESDASQINHLGILDLATHALHTIPEAHTDFITALQWQPELSRDEEPGAMSDAKRDEQQSKQSRLLVTACSDGTVKLWNITRQTSAGEDAKEDENQEVVEPETKAGIAIDAVHTWSMEPPSPAVAITFSPDAHLLAAAGGRSVCFWEIQGKRKLVGKWTDLALDSEKAIAHGPGGHENGEITDHAEVRSAHGQEIGSSLPDQIEVKGDGEEQGDEDVSFHTLAWNCDGSLIAYTQGNRVSHGASPKFASGLPD